jgi:hypothetical protein
LAIPKQNLQQMTAATAKHEQLPAERIEGQVLLYHGSKTIEAAAHIRHPGCQPDAHPRRRRNHPRRAEITRRNVTRLTPSSTRTRLPSPSSISMRPTATATVRVGGAGGDDIAADTGLSVSTGMNIGTCGRLSLPSRT